MHIPYTFFHELMQQTLGAEVCFDQGFCQVLQLSQIFTLFYLT